MPDLNKLPVPEYQAGQPYHWEYDNVPVDALAVRDEIINGEVDIHGAILREANGNQGTLSNRLAQSINPDGSIKSTAIDSALHNVASHTNGTITVEDAELDYYTTTLGYSEVVNPVPFVRMLEAERDKLALIADEATNMQIQVQTISNIVLYEQGPIQLGESDSIQWEITAPNIIKPVLKISTDFAHRHYYDIEPITTDYLNFAVNSMNTPYIEGSLRVYINGIRLSDEFSIYYPSSPIATWTLNQFTSDAADGSFVLDTAITAEDIIRIDFDMALTG